MCNLNVFVFSLNELTCNLLQSRQRPFRRSRSYRVIPYENGPKKVTSTPQPFQRFLKVAPLISQKQEYLPNFALRTMLFKVLALYTLGPLAQAFNCRQDCQLWDFIPRSWEFLKVTGLFMGNIFLKRRWDDSWEIQKLLWEYFVTIFSFLQDHSCFFCIAYSYCC